MRNQINKKPHQPLWLGSVIVLIFAVVVECETIEILLNGNFLAVKPLELALFFVLPLAIMGAFYLYIVNAGKKLTKWMTMFHITFSLFFTITLIFWACETDILSLANNFRLQAAVVIFVLAQVVYFINILKAYLQKN